MSQRKAASRQALLSAPPRLRVNQLLPSAISASSARAPFFPGPCFFYRNLYRRAHSGRGHVPFAPFALHQFVKLRRQPEGFRDWREASDRPNRRKRIMPFYEHVFIARQDLLQAQVDALPETVTKARKSDWAEKRGAER